MKGAKIAILGAPPHFHRLMERFLTKVCRVRVVAVEQADVCIIDMDGLGARDLLADEQRRRPTRPLILLSLQEIDQEGAVCLKKPLQSRELAMALERIQRQREEKPSRQSVTAAPRTAVPSPIPHGDPGMAVKHYDPRGYLQELLAAAYRRALTTDVTLRIELGWVPIVIYPRQHRVWVDADDRKLQAFCRLPLRRVFHLAEDGAPEAAIRPDPEAALQGPPASSQRLDALLWKVAWWNSGGRLPRHIAADRPVQLTRWPNLTRYWHPPQALRIAALLYRSPLDTVAAARILGSPVAEVAGFVSAASALRLLRFPETAAVPADSAAEAQAPSVRQGIFQRIMKRLRGK